ncbi:hypothetical protein [Haliea sp. E17]|uniref:hypothetical protein n=1 Tax=Haliea sp. E17 TaxID=3401576 RepID=UPI003AAA9BF4
MDAVLIILLLMGVCSITLALYILADAKRTFSRGNMRIDPRLEGKGAGSVRYMERSNRDRRSGQQVSFPLRIDGMIIFEDRRKLGDRRKTVVA